MLEAAGRHVVGIKVMPGINWNDMHETEVAATYAVLASELAKRPLAYINIVRPIPWLSDDPSLDTLSLIRSHWLGPLLVGGGLEPDEARELIKSGAADCAVFGRALLANPDLPERLRRGAPLDPPDEATFYMGGSRGYVDYPRLT